MTDEQGVVRKGRRTLAEVEQVVREFESSGLNRSQFCRRQGLTLGALNRYLRRLHAASGNSFGRGGLVAVELSERNSAAASARGLVVMLSRGRRIEVSVGFDALTLQRLVGLLEKM